MDSLRLLGAGAGYQNVMAPRIWRRCYKIMVASCSDNAYITYMGGTVRPSKPERNMTTTYRVVLANDNGSFASIGLAESAGGAARNQVQRFDGERDLAFIDVADAESAEYLETLLEADANVISYAAQ